eukprot:TRINITY_DN13829_c0_g1_i1.p1 TRINITY_DN13829_c0_g1~~TRINITY_DN13829_c0_g1_i1.p1  ORF type:complete len:413 (+),score=136.76 TRINITY_DN13829_c0_g1_i1:62-1300(+)
MFTLLVCADIYGQKVNLEVGFPSVPTINELTRKVEQVYEEESKHMKPQGFPALRFEVSRIQIYDDTFLKWVDLLSSTQLHEYDQLYVFQPQSAWHVDLQKDLPAPRPPTGPAPGIEQQSQVPPQPHAPQATPQYYNSPSQPPQQMPPLPPQSQQLPQQQPLYAQPTGSPFAAPSAPAASPYRSGPTGPAPGAQLPQPTGPALAARERQNVPKEQKVQMVFRELDSQQKGFVDPAELERGFHSRGIDFSSNTVQELFQKGDQNRDGRLDWQEWVLWCDLYPNTLEVMYYRGRDSWDEEQQRRDKDSLVQQVERCRQREEDLKRQLDECVREQNHLRQQLSEQEQRGHDAVHRRTMLEQQERDLLEQEIKLERQKDQLRLSQQRFQEVAWQFDGDAQRQGSPRRARQEQVAQFR